jgi:hypothetical protein
MNNGNRARIYFSLFLDAFIFMKKCVGFWCFANVTTLQLNALFVFDVGCRQRIHTANVSNVGVEVKMSRNTPMSFMVLSVTCVIVSFTLF